MPKSTALSKMTRCRRALASTACCASAARTSVNPAVAAPANNRTTCRSRALNAPGLPDCSLSTPSTCSPRTTGARTADRRLGRSIRSWIARPSVRTSSTRIGSLAAAQLPARLPRSGTRKPLCGSSAPRTARYSSASPSISSMTPPAAAGTASITFDSSASRIVSRLPSAALMDACTLASASRSRMVACCSATSASRCASERRSSNWLTICAQSACMTSNCAGVSPSGRGALSSTQSVPSTCCSSVSSGSPA